MTVSGTTIFEGNIFSGTVVTQFEEETPPGNEWVLGTGIWNDSAFWDDNAIWND